MRARARAICILLTTAFAGCHIAPQPPADAGDPVDRGKPALREWRDVARDRAVPALVRMPSLDGFDAPFPVVLVSHGIGQSRQSYAYLGKALADAGFVVAHVTHVGSDESVYAEPDPFVAALARVSDPDERAERPLDLRFALDQLLADPEIGPRCDPTRVAVVGHSFGAHSAMALAGLRFDQETKTKPAFTDARVRAVVAISPQGPGVMGLTESSWDLIEAPLLTITGSDDVALDSLVNSDRSAAFERSASPDACYVSFDGATHDDFADAADPPPARRQAWVRDETARIAAMFLQRCLLATGDLADLREYRPPNGDWRLRGFGELPSE
ncbi:MAG: alpha/beta fold hydrolase [Phycisphaerales bacterium]|nr:alpha/beta fold hydrolase [Phycisphaerales bacterium]